MRIGLDLDGTMADFHGNLAEIFKWEFHIERTPDPCRWEMWGCWDLTKERFAELFTLAVEEHGVFEQSEPIPGAIEAVWDLTSMGHTLHVVTDRGAFPSAPSQTVKWLRTHGIFECIDSITFTKDKSCVNLDILIDDYTGNCDNLDVGVGHILIDRPWNRVTDAPIHACVQEGWGIPYEDRYNRALNWKEIVEKIRSRS